MKYFKLGIILTEVSMYNKLIFKLKLDDIQVSYNIVNLEVDDISEQANKLQNCINAAIVISSNSLEGNTKFCEALKKNDIPTKLIVCSNEITDKEAEKLQTEIKDFYQFNKRLYDEL